MSQTNYTPAGQPLPDHSKLVSFLRKFPWIIIYTCFILPLVTFVLDYPHYGHMIIYCVASILLTLLYVFLCQGYSRRDRCEPGDAFILKVFAAVAGPAVLILGNVLLPWLAVREWPSVYTGYLIGRLCFLTAITMLFSIGLMDDEPEKQYDEGVAQLRMAWATFALLFASDPILTQYLYTPSQRGEMFIVKLQEALNDLETLKSQTQGIQDQLQAIKSKLEGILGQTTPPNIILALVHLNFCGGITLLVLPLWKLRKLRGIIEAGSERTEDTSES